MKKTVVLICLVFPLLAQSQTTEKAKKDTVSLLKPSPLFIVDGIKKFNADTKAIDLDIKPENIEKIEVIKGRDATILYGDEGKNGAVLITTKKNKNKKAGLTH